MKLLSKTLRTPTNSNCACRVSPRPPTLRGSRCNRRGSDDKSQQLNPPFRRAYSAPIFLVCQACSTGWRCKSSSQRDGREVKPFQQKPKLKRADKCPPFPQEVKPLCCLVPLRRG